MYESFYGLTERPFNLTPDPRYLFLSEKHKEAFAHLMFGIKSRCGFVMVSGEIGTGKTTICRSLLNQLDEGTEIAVILNPCLSPEELLRKINEDFGIDTKAESVKGLIDELNAYLLERNAQGKNCVLLIDEAQNLPPSILEQVRLLSNIETETQKLLQIVLVGQPELAQHLELPELRQLNQRITARYHLKALDLAETMQYIAHRLRQAGGRKKVRFSRSAIRTVYKVSGGTPRVINALCDRALLIGFTREAREISASIIRQAAREIRGEPLRRRQSLLEVFRPFLPNPAMVSTVLFAIVVLLLLLPGGYLERYAGVLGLPGGTSGGPWAALARTQGEAAPSQVAMTEAIKTAVASTVHAMMDKDAPAGGDSKGTPWDSLEPMAACNAAVGGVLRAWNMAVLGQATDSDSPDALTEFARKNGLTCEALSPALDQLLAINLPALVQVKSKDRLVWAALLGEADGKLTLTGESGKRVALTRDAFREMYSGNALVFWKDIQPDLRPLKRTMKGPEVERLQKDLAAVGRLAPPFTGVFDAETGKAVAKIQAETGLGVDGVAGRQIRMILNSWLPNVGTPVLRGKKDVLAGAQQPERPVAKEVVAEAPKPAAEPPKQEVKEEKAQAAASPTPSITPVPAPEPSASASVAPAPVQEPAPTAPAAPADPGASASKEASPAPATSQDKGQAAPAPVASSGVSSVPSAASALPNLNLSAPSTPGTLRPTPVARVHKEELAPKASHADSLPPLKVALPREVTPPAGGVSMAKETKEGNDS